MITKNSFRITFEVNNISTPFTWTGLEGIATFDRAVILADILAQFDLGKDVSREIESNHASMMIKSYKAYRRSHGINSSESIYSSMMTIDQFDGTNWWVVSEDCEEIQNEMGWAEAFDTSNEAYERYQSFINL